MELINEYLIGYKDIDQQHAELIDILNDIEKTLNRKDNHYLTIVDLVHRLEGYVKLHFDYEESLMVEKSYPYIMEHTKEHNEFRYRLQHTYVLDIEKPQEYYVEMSQYLTNWLLKHILHIDKQLVEFIMA